MQGGKLGVGQAGDDGEGAERLALRPASARPQPGVRSSHRPARWSGGGGKQASSGCPGPCAAQPRLALRAPPVRPRISAGLEVPARGRRGAPRPRNRGYGGAAGCTRGEIVGGP
jgi:hypothetical protein